MPPSLTLRPYQQRVIESARDEYRKGKCAVVITIPTGGGKALIAAEVIRGLVSRGFRVALLAPRLELVDQLYRTVTGQGVEAGMIAAKSAYPPNPLALVQVASVGTLLSRGYGDFVPDWIIFDECHLAPANEWAGLMTRFPDAKRMGFTATPARENGNGMSPLFDAIVVGATVRQLTHAGHLAPLDIIEPGRVLKPGQIAQRPVDAYEAHAAGEKALVFAPHVKAALEFRDEFRGRGIACDVVHGGLASEHRARVLAAYAKGELRVVCSVGVLTYGFDDPETSVAILARRCGSVVLYLQIVGRILRTHPDKKRALLCDLTGAVRIHGRPDADRLYSLEGRAIRDGEDAPPGSFCAVCGALMGEDPTCVECGYERAEQEAPRVISVPLKMLASDFCANDSDSVRVTRLTKFMLDGAKKGHKFAAALAKFRGLYHRWPNAAEIAAAKANMKRSAA